MRRILLLAGLCLATPIAAQQPNDRDFFETRVRPLLVEHCYACHSTTAKKQRGSLFVDSRDALLKGGDSGPAIVPNKPDESLLLRAVRYTDERLHMPPKGKLDARQVAILTEWVQRGVPFGTEVKATTTKALDIEAGRKFWSFQPLKAMQAPVEGESWGRGRIDSFLRDGLKKRGLTPAPEADRRTLVRRLYFDLTGLPPTPEAVEAARNDNQDDWYERLAEGLLASPHYGERWARPWLDLARYCDIPEDWAKKQGQPSLYRDWVVRALNEDVPYDRFVTLQLAADLLPQTPPTDRAALGFLGLSPVYWKELKLDKDVIKNVVAEEWEERIHTVGSTFLGLTLACARCHDHKFDPVTQRDYYGLAGVFASIRENDVKVGDKTLAPGVEETSLFVLPDGPHKTKLDYKSGVAQDVALHIRGNPANVGPVVPRRFLSVFSSRPLDKGSGRLDLAKAIVEDAAPLTARVFVNRVWALHFGVGLVDTPSDFGTQGGKPSHPELLDDLAHRFVASGWSMRWLHREIVLSSAYRQSSRVHPNGVDPDNRSLSRGTRRRLDIESWRDAMLTVAGNLDRTIGGASQDLGKTENVRRTLYGTVKRRELNDVLRLHDFPDPTTHSASRTPTTTPLQQLYVLNSPFVQRQSAALATRAQKETTGEEERIRRVYGWLFQREPSEAERSLGREFLKAGSWAEYAQALLGSNEFLFVD